MLPICPSAGMLRAGIPPEISRSRCGLCTPCSCRSRWSFLLVSDSTKDDFEHNDALRLAPLRPLCFPLAVPLLLSPRLSPLFSSYCFSAILPFWQPLPQPSAHPTVAFPPLPATPFPTGIWIWDYCHQVFSKDLETPKLGIRTNSILKVPSISNSRKSVASFWGQDKLNPLKMGSEMKKEPTVSHKPVTVNCSARRMWTKS